MMWIVDDWATRLISVWLQGTLAIGAALLLVRVKRLPVALRVWALRLALLKLHLSAIFVGGFGLAVSPQAEANRVLGGPFQQALQICLIAAFSLWAISVVTGLLRFWRENGKLLDLVREAMPAADEGAKQLYRELCRRMSIRQAPRLLEHPSMLSPVLIGCRRPAIVLPSSLLLAGDSAGLRSVLAHELAHYRHGDLRWSWLSALADALFFFHPLTRPAIRKLRLQEELAADAAAIGATGARPSDYSRTLISFAHATLMATGVCAMADGAKDLDQRIRAVHEGPPKIGKLHRALLLSALLVATSTLIPWTLHSDDPAKPATSLPPGVYAPVGVAARALP